MAPEVLLTSFRVWHTDPEVSSAFADGRSIAVYQPRWFPTLPTLDLFDIRDAHGAWTRPRDFLPDELPPGAPQPDDELLGRYRDALLDLYATRAGAIERWVASLTAPVALCCWCPYDTAARRQLAQFGSFVCHSAAAELVLDALDVPVVRDADRAGMVHLAPSATRQLLVPTPPPAPQLRLDV